MDVDVDARELEHRERVAGGVVDRDVAAHGGDRDQIGVLRRDQHRDCVVEAGIAVEHDRRAGHQALRPRR